VSRPNLSSVALRLRLFLGVAESETPAACLLYSNRLDQPVRRSRTPPSSVRKVEHPKSRPAFVHVIRRSIMISLIGIL
jgi:hypothetical protein